MKRTKSAVKYGIEALKVTPDRMFSLIESSRDYDGDDYERWLASKIIEIAEADGVRFSQLLVKKFNILSELAEESDESSEIRDEYIKLFRTKLGVPDAECIISVGFDKEKEEGFDEFWFNGIDYDSENSFFVNEKLGTKVKNADLLYDQLFKYGSIRFMLKLSTDTSNKKSELYIDARQKGINCKSEGSLLLYRMCSILDAFAPENFTFSFFCPVDFLFDIENREILGHLQDRFIVKGFVVNDFAESIFSCGNYAYCVCTSKNYGVSEQDGIRMKTVSYLTGKEEEVCEEKLYTYIKKDFLRSIMEKAKPLEDRVIVELLGKSNGYGAGCEEALGYLNISGTMFLSTCPVNGDIPIPITKENLKDMIVYYGVCKAREEHGFVTGFNEVVSGHPKYDELLYNCLPIFLFDYNSKFRTIEYIDDEGNTQVVQNKFDVLNSDIVKQLVDVGEVFFSYEAKELFNLCKGFIEFVEKDNIKDKTFNELREGSDNKDLNEAYIRALSNLEDFVSNLHRSMS